uniref:Bm310 n=1 Tax=Brugia malayi TaxID=6279 RepID=A0A0J9XPE7_BRUMA|nr:Bm310 [Brugia malayi]
MYIYFPTRIFRHITIRIYRHKYAPYAVVSVLSNHSIYR